MIELRTRVATNDRDWQFVYLEAFHNTNPDVRPSRGRDSLALWWRRVTIWKLATASWKTKE